MTMRTVLHISCAILVLVQTAEGVGLGLPGLQEIMARWQTYQTNPTLLRIQLRKMMINNRSSAFKLPPPPVVKRKNANEARNQMSISQKKDALKALLYKSAGSSDKSSNKSVGKTDIKPLAISLLQALKSQPSKSKPSYPKQPKPKPSYPKQPKPVSKPLHKYRPPAPTPPKVNRYPPPTKNNKSPSKTNKTMKSPMSFKKFSPPNDLDSGFTPFFKSSKYFDEDSYFDYLTTVPTVEIETTTATTTTTTTAAPQYKSSLSFGEKTRMQYKAIKPLYTTYKPKQYPTKQRKYQSQAPPSYSGFTEGWDSFKDDFPSFSEVPSQSSSEYGKNENDFSGWEKEPNRNRNYLARDKSYNTASNKPKYSEYLNRKAIIDGGQQKLLGNIEESRGFMDTEPFSLPRDLMMNNDPENYWNKNVFPETKKLSVYDKNLKQSGHDKYLKQSMTPKSFVKTNQRGSERYSAINDRNDDVAVMRNEEIEIFEQDSPVSSFGDDFSFAHSNIGEYFEDISDTFPDIKDFGPNWESLKF